MVPALYERSQEAAWEKRFAWRFALREAFFQSPGGVHKEICVVTSGYDLVHTAFQSKI